MAASRNEGAEWTRAPRPTAWKCSRAGWPCIAEGHAGPHHIGPLGELWSIFGDVAATPPLQGDVIAEQVAAAALFACAALG